MRSIGIGVLLLALALGQGGCLWYQGQFDPLHKGDAFDDAQRRFTRLLRWHQLEKASEMVDPQQRQAFLDEARHLRALRFTDYEILVKDPGPELETGTVDVVFYAYTLSTMIERTILVRQDWYLDGDNGRWWVRPEIDTQTRALSQSAP